MRQLRGSHCGSKFRQMSAARKNRTQRIDKKIIPDLFAHACGEEKLFSENGLESIKSTEAITARRLTSMTAVYVKASGFKFGIPEEWRRLMANSISSALEAASSCKQW